MRKISSTSITSAWKFHTVKQNKQRCQYLILWQTIRWEEIPPMSYARASPAVAASNGKIYAIGNATYRQYFRRPCKPIHIAFKIWCRVFNVLYLFYFFYVEFDWHSLFWCTLRLWDNVFLLGGDQISEVNFYRARWAYPPLSSWSFSSSPSPLSFSSSSTSTTGSRWRRWSVSTLSPMSGHWVKLCLRAGH